MRYELKYILTPVQYVLLQRRLKWVLSPDEHASPSGEYFIRSIYFDSPDRVALREKINGVNKRKKYRIRFYSGDSRNCRLECKEKEGTRITKTSQILTSEQTDVLLFGERIMPEKKESLLDELTMRICSEGFEPVVTVDYVREAYVLPFSDLRITFDKSVAWGRVENCLTHERYQTNIYGDGVVLEVKYNEYIPEHISDIIASVRPMQTAASKYAACMEARFAEAGR